MMKDDDLKLLMGFADRLMNILTNRLTDGRTDGRTFVIVESLSRLKTFLGNGFGEMLMVSTT